MNTSETTVTDTVCGMSIDPANAAASVSHGGETYYFCSRHCETKFITAPASYAISTSTAPDSCSCHLATRPGENAG